MDILEVINNVLQTSLFEENLKYCLVNEDKLPFRFDGKPAKTNCSEDFVELNKLITSKCLKQYKGIGISIQANNITAIDIDKCFKVPFTLNSGDERAINILNYFKDIAYCEFSFSGTGIRILFRSDLIENYSKKYYIKNTKNHIEFYEPSNSNRYVTITGRYIYDNKINKISNNDLFGFLNQYMKRPERKEIDKSLQSDESVEKLFRKVKYLYLTNPFFQDLWFDKAPGSGKDESERDFKILIELKKLTGDKDKVKQLFEMSPYYKSKDKKHLNKWSYNNFRYFNYLWEKI